MSPTRVILRTWGITLIAATMTAAAASASGTDSAVLTYLDKSSDKVGTSYTPGPDGTADGHFRLTVSTKIARNIVAIEVKSKDYGLVWDTLPKGDWAVLAVELNGTRLNGTDQGIGSIPTNKPVVLDLYGADSGYSEIFQKTTFVAKITFADHGTLTSTGQSTPATGTPATGSTVPAGPPPPPTTAPDTRKDGHLTHGAVRANNIPDFWIGLSSDKPAVVAGDTLGIGSDGALTAATSNEQLLTVHVFERATGCLIEGAWVELYDPHGKLWTPANRAGSGFRTRFQSRAGLAYMGGLKLTEPGLYHLWIYAQDAQGKVVTQAWLPIQVKDRKGAPFATVNGRPFSYENGKWIAGTRAPASAFSGQSPLSAAGNPFADMFTAFQNLLSGITSGAQRLFSTKQVADARAAAKLLGGQSATNESRLQKAYKDTHLLPSFLVSGNQPTATLQAAVARHDAKVKLVGQDGSSLIGQDGSSLIGQDGSSIVGDGGASLITNDGGRLVSANGTIVATDGATIVATDGATIVAGGAGNIVATDGATIVAGGAGNLAPRSVNSAYAAKPAQPQLGICALGYKKVGLGKTKVVNGSPVLLNDDGTFAKGSMLIAGRNAMPVNAPAP